MASTFFKIDPSGSYLADTVGGTNGVGKDAAPASTKVLLSSFGAAPGSVITLSAVGNYRSAATSTDTSTSLAAVFVNATGQRIEPDAFLGYSTLTQSSGKATSVSQDFFVPISGLVQVHVPVGAVEIWFSVNDTFFSDNTDPDNNFGVNAGLVTTDTNYSGADYFFGTTGNDSLLGGGGNDVFYGGAGSDTMAGGQQLRQPWLPSTAGDYDRLEYSGRYSGSVGAITVDLSARTVVVANEVGTDTYSGIEEIDGVANVKDTVTGRTSSSATVGDGHAMYLYLRGGSDVVNITPYGNQPWADGVTVGYHWSVTPISVVYTSGNTASVTYTASGTQLAGTDTLTNVGLIGDSPYNDTFDLRKLTTNQLGYITDPSKGVSNNTILMGRGGSDTILGNGETSLHFGAVNGSTNGLGLTLDLKLGTADASNLKSGTVALGTETFSGVRSITGTYLNDTLLGGVNDDFESFRGEGGNDFIDGRTGQDRADYRFSTDAVTVNLAAGTATSTSQGTDTLRSIEEIRGSMYDDVLDARGFTGGTTSTTANVGSFWYGFNRFLPEGGNDIIYGNGATALTYDAAMVGIRADLKAGVVDARLDADKLTDAYKTVGRDTFSGVYGVRGTALDDELIGGGSGRTTTGVAIEVFRGNAGNDTIDGGDGKDIADYANSPNAISVNLALSTGQVQDGWGFVDTLRNIEQINASAYADTLIGGAADDVFEGQEGADTIDGAAGYDEISFGNDEAGVTVKLAGWVGTSGVITSGYTGSARDGSGTIDVFRNIEGVEGSNYADSITGDANDNRLDGRGGNDTIDGGAGIDWVEYNQAMQGVRVDLLQGKAFDDGQGIGDAPQTEAVETDTLFNIENVEGGYGNDSIVGSDGANELVGGAGNDTLDGGAGNDTLEGGTGNDSIIGGAGTDTMVLSGPRSNYGVVWSAASSVFTLTSTLDGIDVVTGVESFKFADGIVAASALVDITPPTIAITSDRSTLAAGQVATLTFAISESVSDFAASDITVSGGTLSNFSGSGSSYSATFTPTANSTANGVVSVASNKFSDASSNFNVDGSDPNNTLIITVSSAKPNNPPTGSLVITGVATEGQALSATNTIADADGLGAISTRWQVSSDGLTGWADLASAIGTSLSIKAAQVGLYARAVASYSDGTGVLETVNSTASHKIGALIVGTALGDVLSGTAGDDRIDGGLGADQMTGGLGDDVYVADDQLDLVFESDAQGTDTVISSASSYLWPNVENLTLSGTAYFGVGNALGNVIKGSDGANLLLAGAGNDTVQSGDARDAVYGEAGNDVLYGDGGIDYLIGGTGNDTIFGGDGADEAYGEDGNDLIYGGEDFQTDILVGGAGNDTLDGGQAWDLMYGGTGDDTFYASQQVDWVFENPNEGYDTVIADSPNGYYLFANVEALTLTGSTPFGVGNELDNVIKGNAGVNVLLGGLGNDTLDGGESLDILWGEAGSDVFLIRKGTGIDIIADFTPGTDRLDVRDFGFGTTAAFVSRMSQIGTDIGVDLGNGDSLILMGVQLTKIGAIDLLVV